MSSSIAIHFKSLHWLPVKVRSTYKIACLCYHCHSSTAPSYFTDMLHKKPLHTRNTRSSSYTMPLLNRPAHSKATLGDRSFSFASSSVWNSIPNDVRCAPSLSSFKSCLKTYLFCSVRSTYKIACLCYHCHSSTAPSYVTDMLHKKPLHTRNTRSSSYTMPLLNRPAHSKATLGDRSFSFASSSVWNSIPNDVRCAPSLSSFKSCLKTYFFRSVYID